MKFYGNIVKMMLKKTNYKIPSILEVTSHQQQGSLLPSIFQYHHQALSIPFPVQKHHSPTYSTVTASLVTANHK